MDNMGSDIIRVLRWGIFIAVIIGMICGAIGTWVLSCELGQTLAWVGDVVAPSLLISGGADRRDYPKRWYVEKITVDTIGWRQVYVDTLIGPHIWPIDDTLYVNGRSSDTTHITVDSILNSYRRETPFD